MPAREQLIQVLAFTAVPGGSNATLPHNINNGTIPQIPDIIERDNAGFSIVSVTATHATVHNNGGSPDTLNLWLELKHSIQRAFGDIAITGQVPRPFVPAAGGGGGPDADAVIFDDSVPGTNSNIRSDRAANQSPIDNTQSQITNLGSQDLLVNPTATGATGKGATIGGGDDNSAGPAAYGTVSGGAGNTVVGALADTISGGQQNTINASEGGFNTIGGGFQNTVDGTADTIGGGNNNHTSNGGGAQGTIGGGGGNTTAGSGPTIGGGLSNQALLDSDTVAGGNTNVADGPNATVGGGSNNTALGQNVTISGGASNQTGTGESDANYSTIGGGQGNQTGAEFATVGGGQANNANSLYGTIGGGSANILGVPAESQGDYSTIGGGSANLAQGQYDAIGGGQGNQTNPTGDHDTVGGGHSNLITGTSNLSTIGGGLGNQVQNAQAGAIGGGRGNVVSADDACIPGGANNQASAFGAVAAGSLNRATAATAVAMGASNLASGPNAIALGESNTASGEGAVALGVSDVAVGEGALATGVTCQANGDWSQAQGLNTIASRTGQTARSSGGGGITAAVAGDTQASDETMSGSTPGGAPGETVELQLGDNTGPEPFEFQDGRGYLVEVRAIARGTIGTPQVHAWKATLAVRRDAGVSVIASTFDATDGGDAATATWTFVASIGAAPDRLVLTFGTGATTAAVRVTADLHFVEINNP